MSIITKLDKYNGADPTTLVGLKDSDCTYEIFEEMLILRTNTSDTIHIGKEIGKQLIKIIVDELL